MASYSIQWKKSATRELKHLDKAVVSRIIEAVSTLATNPRPQGYRKLTGAENSYRVRVGHYRIIYSIMDKNLIVEIIRVGHRRDVYR